MTPSKAQTQYLAAILSGRHADTWPWQGGQTWEDATAKACRVRGWIAEGDYVRHYFDTPMNGIKITPEGAAALARGVGKYFDTKEQK